MFTNKNSKILLKMMGGGEGDTQFPMDEEKMRTHLMFIEDNRVKSFKDWVFDRCECTPKKVTLLFGSGRNQHFESLKNC